MSSDIYAPKAQQLRRERVQKLTGLLTSSEGQNVVQVLQQFSLAIGVSMRTVEEYWEVISQGNRGMIYEKHGLIKIRKLFRKYVK